MEPRRPKHKQAPPLVVSTAEIERALLQRQTYDYSVSIDDTEEDPVFPSSMTDDPIHVIHTHMSVVFVLPNRVYKVKKPVDFGFADFTTLYKRFQACFAEVQLNQRLAPDIYMGVVPISMHRETRKVTVRCDDFWTPEKSHNLEYWLNDKYGEIVEWAVHMVRLPEEQTLMHYMDHGEITQEMLAGVADMLVDFHANARRGPAINVFGKEEIIRKNIDENFQQTESHVGVTVSEEVYRRVKELTYTRLTELRETIASRVTNGYICDSHGDLRLEHVYMMPTTTHNKAKKKETKFVVLDCIEFNEHFRYGDPLSDAAFLMMDLWRKGRPDLARYFQQQYLLKSTQDSAECAKLFVFYAAYRAVVRAKVGGFCVMDPNISEAQRNSELQRSRCYWLIALNFLSSPAERPCLVLVGGLPASGKSNLARMLAGENQTQMVWLRADSIRKELYQADKVVKSQDDTSSPTGDEDDDSFEEGLYTPKMTQRTYDEILHRCVDYLQEGKRVVVDATFRDPAQRQKFITTARQEGALFAFIICECDREIIKGRLLARKDDVSDATWEVFEHMEKNWSISEDEITTEYCMVNTEKEKELTLRRANVFLRKIEIL